MVPDNRWNCKTVGQREGLNVPGMDGPYSAHEFTIDATSDEQAELRLLAVINHDFEDNTHGYQFISDGSIGNFRWSVLMICPEDE